MTSELALPLVTAGWDRVLARVADERDVHSNPMTPETATAVAELVVAVEHACRQTPDRGGRRWLAAALAALSHQVQLSTLPPPTADRADGPGGTTSRR
jgi:hypothetical protein